jgi:hypothetical protein
MDSNNINLELSLARTPATGRGLFLSTLELFYLFFNFSLSRGNRGLAARVSVSAEVFAAIPGGRIFLT